MGNYCCTCESQNELDKYKIIDYIGNGAYGKIYVVKKKKSKKISIMKSVKNIRAIDNEIIYFDLNLNHDNLIKYDDLFFYNKKLYIIMDRYDIDLLDYLSDKGKISEDQTKIYVKQILSALRELEKLNYYHLDLKLENILLNYRDRNRIVLTDFGFMNNIRNNYKQIEVKNIIGTKLYLAPEITKVNIISKKSDIWSLGIITYMMLNNFRLEGYNEKFIRASCKELSDDCVDFLIRSLENNFVYRMSIIDCLLHKWLSY